MRKTPCNGRPRLVRPCRARGAIACAMALACSMTLAPSPPAQPALAAESGLQVDVPDAVYTGAQIRPQLSVTYDGRKLMAGTDYLTSWRNNVNAGSATVTVTGNGGYQGHVSRRFTISPAPMDGARVEGVAAAYPFTGTAVEPQPTVRFGAKLLQAGRDYDISYRDNAKAGTASIVLTGKRNLAGTKTVSFQITASGQGGGASGGSASSSSSSASQGGPSPSAPSSSTSAKPAGGKPSSSSGTAKPAGGSKSSSSATGGKAKSSSSSAKLPKKSLAKATVSVKGVTYTGKALKPAVSVKLGGTSLKAGRDYRVEYANNVKPGTGTVKAVGIGSYAGSKSSTFAISKASIAKAEVDPLGARYTTSLSKVKPKPKASYGGRVLQEGTDYTLSYKSNKLPGTATVTLRGKGCFTGSKAVKFKLVNLGDDLARAACRLSYSRQAYQSGGKYPGTAQYGKAVAKVSKRQWAKGRSCDIGVAIVLRWSGFDKSFPEYIKPHKQQAYLGYRSAKGTSSKWRYVGAYKKGDIKGSKLQPGDVMIAANKNGNDIWHVMMYVGKDIAKEVYRTHLKGGDADLGTPKGNFVSAHWGSGLSSTRNAALCICDGAWSLADHGSYSGQWEIFRCVKPSDAAYRAGKAVR